MGHSAHKIWFYLRRAVAEAAGAGIFDIERRG